MNVAILIDGGRMWTCLTAPGRTVHAGACPCCRAALRVDVPTRDADAVCEACGAYVGRVIVRATVSRSGVVRHAA